MAPEGSNGGGWTIMTELTREGCEGADESDKDPALCPSPVVGSGNIPGKTPANGNGTASSTTSVSADLGVQW